MFTVPAVNQKDGYKVDHRNQYVEDTRMVYSNITARISRYKGIDRVLVFNVTAAVREWFVYQFKATFFDVPKEVAVKAYKRRIENYIGKDAITYEHIDALHDLGYLPVEIKALPEGTLAPLRIPILTIKSTANGFGWVTNFVETLLSNIIWHPITVATIAYQYRVMLHNGAMKTNAAMVDFVKWQGHDFHFRGAVHPVAGAIAGAAHLTCFTGSDTIPAIDYLEQFYHADCEKELIAGTVPATEHSVMCIGLANEPEIETYRRLITKVYPKGIVSIVSDTIDYFKTLNETVRALKPEIMGRDGKVVIRPDSGDPFKIICGDLDAPEGSLERKGTMDILWEVFGGHTTKEGFKQLDAHIGVIYGDSITLEKCEQILNGLMEKGYATTNMVFGIGSYTYQYVTRDSFGFAMKATGAQVGEKFVELYKDPKTDGGVKKSAKGLLCVMNDMTLKEQCTPEEEKQGLLQTIFVDGKMTSYPTLAEIREKVDASMVL